MDDRWWVNDDADADSNNANNWSAVEGGAGGAGVPSSSDNAYFSATSSATNCTLSVAFACINLYMASADTGGTDDWANTLDFATYGIAVSGNLVMSSGATITATATGITDVAGNVDLAGTYTPGTTTMRLNGTGAQNFDSGGNTVQKLNHNGSGTVEVNATLTITDDLTLSGGGTFDFNGNTIAIGDICQLTSSSILTCGAAAWSIGASLNNIAGTINANSSTLTLTGSGNINTGGSSLNALTVDSTGVFTMLSDVTVAHQMVLKGSGELRTGVYDLSCNLSFTQSVGTATLSIQTSGGVSCENSFISTAGTLTTASGTIVTLSGTGTLNVTTGNFYNLVINASGDIVTLGADLTDVSNDLTVTAGTFDISNYAVTVGGALDIDSTLKLKGGQTFTVTGSTAVTGSTVIYYDNAVTAVVTNFPGKIFNNLTFGASKTHEFATGAPSEVTVNGALDSAGAGGTEAILRAVSDASAAWYIDLQGTSSLTDDVNVKYSNASSGNEISAVGSDNSGNNTNWDFAGTAPQYTWTGDTNSNWNNILNWGDGTDGIPTSGHTASFDGFYSVVDCNLDTSPTIATLSVQSDYSGTIDCVTFNLAVTNSVTISGGTFDNGTGTLTIGLTASGGGGTFTVDTVGGAVWTTGTGTVKIQGNDTTANTGTAQLYNLILNKSNIYNLTVTGTITVNNDFTNSQVARIQSGTIDVKRHVNANYYNADKGGTGKIKMSGAVAQVLTCTTGSTCELEFANTSGGITVVGTTLRVFNGASVTAGTVDFSGLTSIQFYTSSTEGTYTITMGSAQLPNTQIYAINAYTVTITGTLDVNGTLTTTAIQTLNGGTIKCSGTWDNNDTSWSGSATIEMDGTGEQNIDIASGSCNLGTITLLISNTSGFVKITGATGNTFRTDTVTVDAGAKLCSNANDITVDGTFTNNGVVVELTGDTVTAPGAGSGSLFTGVASCAALTLYGSGATWNTPGNWGYTTGASDGVIPTSESPIIFDANSVSMTMDVAGDCASLDIQAAFGSTLANATFDLTVVGDVTQDGGTWTLGTATTISCGGSFVRNAGTFTRETSLIKMTGTGNFDLSASSPYDIEIDSSGTVTLLDNLNYVRNSVTVTSGIFDIGALLVRFGAGGFIQTGGTVTGSGELSNYQYNGGITISGTATNTAALSVGSSCTINVSSVNVNFDYLWFRRQKATTCNFTLTGTIPCVNVASMDSSYGMALRGTGTVEFSGDMANGYSGTLISKPDTGGGNLMKWVGSGTSTYTNTGGVVGLFVTEFAGSGTFVVSQAGGIYGDRTNGARPDFIYTSGTITPTAKITLKGAADIDWSAGSLIWLGDVDITLSVTSGGYTIAGTLNIGGDFATPSGPYAHSWVGAGGIKVKGNISLSQAFGVGYLVPLELAGDVGTQSITSSSVGVMAWIGAVTISNTAGLVSAASELEFVSTVTVNASARLCSNGNDITVDGTFTNNGIVIELTGDTVTAPGAGTGILYTGKASCSDIPLYASGADWNAAGSWGYSSGSSDGIVPTSSIDVIFDANSISMSLSAAGDCKEIDIQAGFSSTLDNGIYDMTATGNITKVAGTWDAGIGTLSCNGNFDVSAGTFNPQGSTIVLTGASTISIGSNILTNFTIDSASSITITGTVVCNDFRITAIGTDFDGGTLNVKDDVILNAQPTNSTVALILSGTPNGAFGGASTTITCFASIAFNKTGGSFSFNASDVITGAFTTNAGAAIVCNLNDNDLTCTSFAMTDGTITAGAGTILCSGSFTVSAGTFNEETGTIKLTGSGTFNPGVSQQLYNVEVDASGTYTAGVHAWNAVNEFRLTAGTFDLAGLWGICGDFIMTDGVFDLGTNNGISCDKNIDISGGSFAGGSSGNLTSRLAEATITIDTNGISVPSFRCIKTGGTATLLSNFACEEFLVDCSGATFDCDTFNITCSGGITQSDGVWLAGDATTISCGGNFTISAGTFNEETSLVKITGTSNISITGTDLYNLEIDSAGNTVDNLVSVTVTNNFTVTAVGTLNGSTGPIKFQGNYVGPASAVAGALFIETNGSNSSTISGFMPQILRNARTATSVLTLVGNFGCDSLQQWSTSTSTFDFDTYDVTLTKDFDMNSGIVTAGSGTITVGRGFDIANGTFNPETSLVKMTGSGRTIKTNGNNFYDLEIDATGIITLIDVLDSVTHNFTITAGTFDMDTFDITVAGAVTQNGGIWNAGDATTITHTDASFDISGGTFNKETSTIKLTGVCTINGGTNAINNITLDMSSNSLTATGVLDVDGTFTINSVSTIVSGTIRCSGNIVHNDNGVGVTSAILEFDGSGTQTITGTSTSGSLPSYKFSNSGTVDFQIDTRVDGGAAKIIEYVSGTVDFTGTTLEVEGSGTVNIDAGSIAFDNVTILGKSGLNRTITGTMDVDGDFTIQGALGINGGTITVAGNIVLNDTGMSGTTAITWDGSGSKTLTAGAGSGEMPDGTFTINGSGTLTLASAFALDASGQGFVLQDGTFDCATFAFSINDTYTQNGGIMDAGTGTMTVGGNFTIAGGSFTYGVGATLLLTGSCAMTFGGESVNNVTVNNGANTVTMQDTYSIAGTLTFTAGTVDLNGQDGAIENIVTTAGTFTMSTGTCSIGGDADLSNLTSLTSSSALIQLNGSSTQAINFNDETFDTMTVTNASDVITFTSGWTVSDFVAITASAAMTFDNTATYTISTVFRVYGTSVSDIVIQSDSAGVAFDIDVAAATREVGYVSLKDAAQIDGTDVTVSFGEDISGNSGWLFYEAFIWNGAGSDELATTGDNWIGDVAPTSSNAVRFDTTSAKNCTLDLSGVTLTNIDIITGYSGVISMTEDQSLTANFTQSDGTFNIATTKTLDVDGSLAINVGATFSDAASVVINVGTNVVINAGSTTTLTSATLTLDGSVAQSFTSGGKTISHLSITNSTDVVTIVDSTTVSTSTLSQNVTVEFTAATTFTLTTMNWAGADISNRATVRSTSDGNAWLLVAAGTPEATFINVKDSDASGGNPIDASDSGVNNGGNTNWLFPSSGGVPVDLGRDMGRQLSRVINRFMDRTQLRSEGGII